MALITRKWKTMQCGRFHGVSRVYPVQWLVVPVRSSRGLLQVSRRCWRGRDHSRSSRRCPLHTGHLQCNKHHSTECAWTAATGGMWPYSCAHTLHIVDGIFANSIIHNLHEMVSSLTASSTRWYGNFANNNTCNLCQTVLSLTTPSTKCLHWW